MTLPYVNIIYITFLCDHTTHIRATLSPPTPLETLSPAKVKTKRMLHARPRLYMHIGP